MLKSLPLKTVKLPWLLAAAVIALSLPQLIISSSPAQAACAPLDTTNGTVTQTVNIPAAGTYTIWSRIMAPDATSNSYYLEIDDTTCGVNIGDSAITANTWAWVDYKNGSTNTKVTATLTVGNHTVRMVGKEAGVKLDRVLFLQDTCVPTGTGDNCTVSEDTTAPSVSITAPAAAATVSGTTTISANASDAVGVTRVEFLVDGTVINTDTVAPYSYSWNTTTATNASHTLTAKAYDAANNNTTSTAVSVTVNNASAGQPDLIVTAITASPASPVNGQAVTFSATIKNQGTAATPAGVIHGIGFSVGGTAATWSDNNSNSLAAGASVALTASGGPAGSATWAATTGTHTVQANVDDVNRMAESNEANNTLSVNLVVTATPDTTPPTTAITSPTNGSSVSSTVNVTATATDNVGVTRAELYIDGTLAATDVASPYSFSWNTASYTNASHSLSVRAYDAAGNSRTSTIVAVTVNNAPPVGPKPGDVNGDGAINVFDASIMLFNYGKSGQTRAQGDLNGDGIVNVFDASVLLFNWGK